MTTDLGNVTAAMRGETDSAVRIHRYLNGEDGIDALAFVCTYSRQNDVAVATLAGNFRTLRLTENCTGPTITFENHYWLGRSGLPIKSVQWVGPNVGYAEIEQTTAQ
ncbi:hypothetical protein P775_04550 [Puniceibacterium antarcticum]|uniref:Uncharacterized protein n=2 Tax=Puniceibacterium antarcticum TaxID=1206336 RepID=A0A2G8RIL9_9RHOB|nr:hypothetical protein P775_04550 [Puniceibacterium antarcticum]